MSVRLPPVPRTKPRLQIRPKANDILRNPFVRLRLALVLGFVIIGIGTAGYMAVAHYSPLDALYMTIITLSTVGYGEVHPLTVSGKIFTMFLIIGGIGTAAWVFTTIIEVFVSDQTVRILGRKRMDRVVTAMRDHYIVCGYGRIGQEIASGYTKDRVPFVVVEQEPARLELLRSQEVPHVEGDAADDAILTSAGIHHAAALIAVTPTDAVNTFIVLSARGLQPNLYIVARADTLQNEAKLYRAGATKVISPHILGGRWMAITAINPAVTDFITAMTELDHTQFRLLEYTLTPFSPVTGKTFGEAHIKEQTGALIIAVRKSDGNHFIPNPPGLLRLLSGDMLIAIGTVKQHSALAPLVNSAPPDTAAS